MPDQANHETMDHSAKKKAPVSSVRSERSSGFLFWLVALICIFMMLIGTGSLGKLMNKLMMPIGTGPLSKLVFTTESQLPEIYGTAMTLCLSCIGLGEINFKILGSIAGLLVITLVVYKIIAMATKKTGGQHGK